MFGHDPPTKPRSTTAVRRPSLALVQAVSLPPAPLPKISTSYRSISLIVIASPYVIWLHVIFPPVRMLTHGGSFRLRRNGCATAAKPLDVAEKLSRAEPPAPPKPNQQFVGCAREFFSNLVK